MAYYYGELYHHGILGQKWGVRRFQNADGTLTEAGRARLGRYKAKETKIATRYLSKRADRYEKKANRIQSKLDELKSKNASEMRINYKESRLALRTEQMNKARHDFQKQMEAIGQMSYDDMMAEQKLTRNLRVEAVMSFAMSVPLTLVGVVKTTSVNTKAARMNYRQSKYDNTTTDFLGKRKQLITPYFYSFETRKY